MPTRSACSPSTASRSSTARRGAPERGGAVVAGAGRAGRAAILALSQTAVRFHGSVDAIAAAYRMLADSASVPIGLHLDHVEEMSLVERAPELGFGSVMFDASTLAYDDNVAATRAAADFLHDRGL